MRKATAKYDVDMSKPLEDIVSTDCFGFEYDAREHECSICSSANACAMMFRKHRTKMKLADIGRNNNLIDQVNFDRINKKKLFTTLVTTETLYADLEIYVKKRAKCKSPQMVEWWIKLFFEEYKLMVENDIIWKK